MSQATLRQQIEFVQRQTGDGLRRSAQAPGCRQRRRLRIESHLAGPPERREDAVRSTLAGADFPRFVQQVRVVALAFEAQVAQAGLDRRITRDGGRIVETIPHDLGGTDLARKLGQRGQRGSSTQGECNTLRAQRRIESGQAVVQPPSTRSTRRPGAFFFRCVHVHRHDVVAVRHGRGKRRVVRQPQVAPEPDESGRVAHAAFTLMEKAAPREERGLRCSPGRVSRPSCGARRCALPAAGAT